MRVLTWNVLDRDREQRIDLLVDRLERVGPDIVVLQETSDNHAAQVAERLEMQVVGCGRPHSGATLSSVPAVLCSSAMIVPRGEVRELTWEGRTYAVLRRLRLPDESDVLIGSVHLSAGPLDTDRLDLAEAAQQREDRIVGVIAVSCSSEHQGMGDGLPRCATASASPCC